MEQSRKSGKVGFNCYVKENEESTINLKIFCPVSRLTLSDTLPIIEHLGFCVINAETYEVMPENLKKDETLYLSHFTLKSKFTIETDKQETCDKANNASA